MWVSSDGQQQPFRAYADMERRTMKRETCWGHRAMCAMGRGVADGDWKTLRTHLGRILRHRQANRSPVDLEI